MPAELFRSSPHPIHDYQKAKDAIKQIQASEGDEYNPETKTILLTHGKKTKKTILWLHGYTATTRQFLPLARLCHEKAGTPLCPACLTTVEEPPQP